MGEFGDVLADPVLSVEDETSAVRVLIGSTGPRSNVLKIRPPLVISPKQVEKVAATVLDAIEEEERCRQT